MFFLVPQPMICLISNTCYSKALLHSSFSAQYMKDATSFLKHEKLFPLSAAPISHVRPYLLSGILSLFPANFSLLKKLLWFLAAKHQTYRQAPIPGLSIFSKEEKIMPLSSFFYLFLLKNLVRCAGRG